MYTYVYIYICIYICIYMYRCVFCIRFRGNFPVIFQARVFSQRNRTATRSGPFTASCVSEMQLEFFPQGPPKQPPPLDRCPSAVLEDVRIPSPAFVPCFYGHLAMCVWSAPRFCAQKSWRIFFHSELTATLSLTSLHWEVPGTPNNHL